MAVAPASERGISRGVEPRPFGEVPPKEIAEKTGGQVIFVGGEPSFITYRDLGSYIAVPGATLVRKDGNRENLFDTVVIEEDEHLVFVKPPTIGDSLVGFEKSISGVKISRAEGISTFESPFRDPFGRMNPVVKQAAEVASQRAEQRRQEKVSETRGE